MKDMGIEEMIQLAREDVARNRFTSAEKTLGQAILMNNQVADAFYLLGLIYTQKGRLKKAIASFERALSLDPLHTEAAISLSSLYNDMGNYREGAGVYYRTKKRLEVVPPGRDPRINSSLAKKHFELGQQYLKYERFEEGFAEFAKALQLEPSNTQYAVKMAICLSKTGNKLEAIQQLKKLIQLNPKSVEARIQLGVLYHSQRQLKDAFREWQEALALDPENSNAQMYMSMMEEHRVQSDSPASQK